MRRALLFCCGMFVLLGIGITSRGDDPDTGEGADADGPRVYDEQADAREQIDHAIRAVGATVSVCCWSSAAIGAAGA